MNDFPNMTRNELKREWVEARGRFDAALAIKIEADRVYILAANQLNTLERQVKKLEQQEASAKRKAARILLQVG